MGFRIATNIPSLSAQRTLGEITKDKTRAFGQLSSGDRITSAAVDPSGMAISEKMKAKIRSQGQSIRNANDAISFFQVAEGNLNEISSIGLRLKELAVASSSDSYGVSERQMMHKEFENLKYEIDKIAKSAKFNGHNLLNGKSSTLDFQVGTENAGNNRISFATDRLNSDLGALGIKSTRIDSKYNSQQALGDIDNMLQSVSEKRSELGAKSKRLESASENTTIGMINSKHSNSVIRDADVAKVSAEKVSLQIREEATTGGLKLTNHAPMKVTKLLESV